MINYSLSLSKTIERDIHLKHNIMTNSEIFTAAHKLTRETIKSGDSYSATFGLCLSFIYANGVEEESDVVSIELEREKVNEIDYSDFCKLYDYDNISLKCSKNQIIMRMTTEQFDEAIEALEDGLSVEIN